MVMYKVRCNRCGKYKLKTEMIRMFQHNFCHECNCYKRITANFCVHIPFHLMKQYGLFPKDFIIIKDFEDGFLIEKCNFSSNKRRIGNFNLVQLNKRIVGNKVDIGDFVYFSVVDNKIFFEKSGCGPNERSI